MSIDSEVIVPVARTGDGVFEYKDLDILERTNQIRLSAIEALVPPGTPIPSEKADKSFLIQLLRDTDSQVISKARTRVTAKVEQGAADSRALTAQLLLAHRVEVPPSRRRDKAVEMPKNIPLDNEVPGERDMGVIVIDREAFMEKHG